MKLIIIFTVLLSFTSYSIAYSNSNDSSISKDDEKLIEDNNKQNIKALFSEPVKSETLDSSESYESDIEDILPIKDEFKTSNEYDLINEPSNNRGILITEASTFKLRYASLSEEEDRKDKDYIKVNTTKSKFNENNKNNRSPQIFSNPKFSQIFGQNSEPRSLEEDITTRSFYPRTFKEARKNTDSDVRVDLGGYHRLYQNENSPNNPNFNSEEKSISENSEEENKENLRGEIINVQQQLRPRQNINYIPNQVNPFLVPHVQHNYPESHSRSLFGYSDHPSNNLQNQQVIENSIFGKNTDWLEQLRHMEIATYPPSSLSNNDNFDPGLPVSRNDYSVLQNANPNNIIEINSPMNHQRTSVFPISVQHRNSYPIFTDIRSPLTTNHQMYNPISREPFFIERNIDPAYIYPRNNIGPINPLSNSLRDQYTNSYFTHFIHEPGHVIRRNNPIPNFTSETEIINRKDTTKTLNSDEKNSEPTNQIQDAESKLNGENLYLNYPTTKAGYGTQERLPSQNVSNNDSIKELEKNNFESVNNDLYNQYNNFEQNNFPTNRQAFKFSAGNPFVAGINNSESLPLNKTSSGTSFNDDPFYKNFQFPPQLNYPLRPSIYNPTFFDFPRNILGNNPVSNSSTQDNNRVTSNKNRPLPHHAYNFFNIYGQGPTNEDATPKCIENSTAAICFVDEDYPRNEILQTLNREPYLLRFLPSITVSDSSRRDDENRSPEDENKNICPTNIIRGYPLRAQNAKGKWKIIINLGGDDERFSQRIVMESCGNVDVPCSYIDGQFSSRCVQKSNSQRLFVWNRERGLHTDVFTFPTTCSCQVNK